MRQAHDENNLAALDDSILGFEPSLEYIGDRERIEWKINQVEEEIAMLKALK